MKHTTYPFEDLHPGAGTLFFRFFRPLQWVLGYAVSEVAVGSATEGSTTKDELIGANTEGPPVDMTCVAAFG
jgi:hypothetical protein